MRLKSSYLFDILNNMTTIDLFPTAINFYKNLSIKNAFSLFSELFI